VRHLRRQHQVSGVASPGLTVSDEDMPPAVLQREDVEIPPCVPDRSKGQSNASAQPPEKIAGRRRRLPVNVIRLRDKEHCKFVARQAVCGRAPAEAHHLRFAQPRALRRKVSDEYTVPVSRLHHRELHRYGDEVSSWAEVNVDPVPIALELWRRSRSGAAHSGTLFGLSTVTSPRRYQRGHPLTTRSRPSLKVRLRLS
jgi:hypothetical protein